MLASLCCCRLFSLSCLSLGRQRLKKKYFVIFGRFFVISVLSVFFLSLFLSFQFCLSFFFGHFFVVCFVISVLSVIFFGHFFVGFFVISVLSVIFLSSFWRFFCHFSFVCHFSVIFRRIFQSFSLFLSKLHQNDQKNDKFSTK